MTDEFRQKGVNILITGLSLQAASLATFLVLCCEYAWRVKHAEKAEREDKFEALRERRRFRWFLAGKLTHCHSHILRDEHLILITSFPDSNHHRRRNNIHTLHLPRHRAGTGLWRRYR